MAYSVREAANVVGLSEGVVRGCARAGFLTPGNEAERRPRKQFSFRDLLILRVVKDLVDQGVPLRRVRRELAALRRRMPTGASLSEVTIRAEGGHVVVRAPTGAAWEADTGQTLFPFADEATPRGEMQALPTRREAEAPEPVRAMNSDEWFERAVELEESDPEAAIEAYQRALHLRPDCSETLINLGRLRAEAGDTAGAADCFAEALRIDPRDATALYNLGVVAQDDGRDADAIDLYRRALDVEPNLAEAHYNLATLFDRRGDGHAAIRHINAYRKLTRTV